MPAIDRYLQTMHDLGASDLHMVAGAPPLLRIDGRLRPLKHPPFEDQHLRELLYELLDEEQRRDFEATGDADLAYEIPQVARYRVNLFDQFRGAGAVFRLIPARVLTMEELGVPDVLYRFTKIERGLVLITGPTGSGKSTTMAAIIDNINRNRKAHIITIEDPVEFVHQPMQSLITQREVHHDTETFSTALRAAIREDPDVVLVGEMRDAETVGLAVTAAEMGILVFGTLHTNSAPKAVDRIVDSFPADQQPQIRTQLSESLEGVVAQQLLRRAGGKGRVAAHEVLIGSPALGNLIREGKTHQIPSLMQTGKKEGMRSMDQALVELVMAGLITPEEAMTKARDKAALEALAGRIRSGDVDRPHTP